MKNSGRMQGCTGIAWKCTQAAAGLLCAPDGSIFKVRLCKMLENEPLLSGISCCICIICGKNNFRQKEIDNNDLRDILNI